MSVGENLRFAASSIIFNERNSVANIISNANTTQCTITMSRNSELSIAEGYSISGKITVGLNSKIIIGIDFTVTSNITFRTVESTKIDIGDDYLFGSDIIIRTTDGHPIYNAHTKKRINLSQSITIGKHVWIADRAVVLKGASLGNASVLGVGSVPTNKIGAHSVAVRNPAKVVKSDITWERSPNIRSEEFYFNEE
ncbi:hypothetical protein F2982_06895 [Rhizobium sp. BG4]|nr:hypothetical protein F2982_06895 [Rhizobium sp. BG4]